MGVGGLKRRVVLAGYHGLAQSARQHVTSIRQTGRHLEFLQRVFRETRLTVVIIPDFAVSDQANLRVISRVLHDTLDKTETRNRNFQGVGVRRR